MEAKVELVQWQQAPVEFLELLANDADDGIRAVVIFNPALPRTALLQLTQDENEVVRQIALERLNET